MAACRCGRATANGRTAALPSCPVMRSTRRQFLAATRAASAAALVLAACGSDASSSSSDAPGDYDLALRLTDSPLLVPGESRLALSLVSEQTLLASGPATLEGADPRRRRQDGDRAHRRPAQQRHPPGLLAVPLHDHHARLLPAGDRRREPAERQLRGVRPDEGRHAVHRRHAPAVRHPDRRRPPRRRAVLLAHARPVPVARHHAHPGAAGRQAAGVHGRHAGALPDRARARRRWSSW